MKSLHALHDAIALLGPTTLGAKGRLPDAAREHRLIVEAITKRDGSSCRRGSPYTHSQSRRTPPHDAAKQRQPGWGNRRPQETHEKGSETMTRQRLRLAGLLPALPGGACSQACWFRCLRRRRPGTRPSLRPRRKARSSSTTISSLTASSRCSRSFAPRFPAFSRSKSVSAATRSSSASKRSSMPAGILRTSSSRFPTNASSRA